MAILRILQYPDPRLGKKAIPVDVFDEEIKTMIQDMLDTLHHTENCAGLAATQLDIKNPRKITVIYDYSANSNNSNPQLEKEYHSLCLVNPEIVEREGESYEAEGCMSVSGGVYEPVRRALKVKVHALDQNGKPFEIVGEGYMAKLLQHELDHLNGVIFIDRLSRLKRQRIDKKITKFLREQKD